jgi:cell division protein ZipA
MAELRWLILVLGAAFVVAVFLAARRQERRRQRRRRERTEPVLSPAAGNDDWEIERIEPGISAATESFADEGGHVDSFGDDAEGRGRDGALPGERHPSSASAKSVGENSSPYTHPRSDDVSRPLPVVNARDAVRSVEDTAAPDPAADHRSDREPATRPKRERRRRPGGEERQAQGRGAQAARPESRRPEQLELGQPVADTAAGEAGESASADFEEVISLRLVPRGNDPFDGNTVAEGLTKAGLVRGHFDIFHYTPTGASASVFSIANLVEPGTLRDEDLDGRQLPGLTVFMLLPGPMAGVEALQEMILHCRLLANYLEAEVQDDTGGSLTRQTEEHLKERIVAFEHRRARSGR